MKLKFALLCLALNQTNSKTHKKLGHRSQHNTKKLRASRKEGPEDAVDQNKIYQDNLKLLLEDKFEFPEKKLADVLKQPTYPGNPDCDELGEDRYDGKNINVYLKHFDKGAAPYFYDLLDVLFEETIKEETTKAMSFYTAKGRDDDGKLAEYEKYFGGSKEDEVKDLITAVPGINQKGLQALFTDIKYKQFKPKTVIQTLYHDMKTDDDSVLNFRQSMYFMTHFLARRKLKCDHCFQKSFEKIGDLFLFMDCDGNGLIEAKDLMKLFKNLDEEKKIPFKVTNTMVNAFFLNGMEVPTATMSLVDFKYAVMMGFVERYIPKNQLDIEDQKGMKELRLQAVKDGSAPS